MIVKMVKSLDLWLFLYFCIMSHILIVSIPKSVTICKNIKKVKDAKIWQFLQKFVTNVHELSYLLESCIVQLYNSNHRILAPYSPMLLHSRHLSTYELHPSQPACSIVGPNWKNWPKCSKMIKFHTVLLWIQNGQFLRTFIS